jgi:hypothetical protein
MNLESLPEVDERHISYFLADNNPKAVYEFLKGAHGDLVDVNFSDWQTSTRRRQMAQQLQYLALQSGDPDGYYTLVASIIPYNPEAANWTNPDFVSKGL